MLTVSFCSFLRASLTQRSARMEFGHEKHGDEIYELEWRFRSYLEGEIDDPILSQAIHDSWDFEC